MQQLVDVIVVGGGASGVAAAVGAKEAGAKNVLILEKSAFLGGTATLAEVGTICGLYYNGVAKPEFANPGFSQVFAERLLRISNRIALCVDKGLWILPYSPLDFEHNCQKILEEKKVSVSLQSTVETVLCEENTISEIKATNVNGIKSFKPSCVIDCSGTAIVTRLAGGNVFPNDRPQASAFVFSITGLPQGDTTVLSREIILAVKRAVKAGMLAQACQKISIVPGSYINNQLSLKLGLDLFAADCNLQQEQHSLALDLVASIVEFLKSDSQFQKISLLSTAKEIGVRTGIRAIGHKVLKSQDVLECKKHERSATRGVWPIEEWLSVEKPTMHYLPDGEYYDIAYGCLRSDLISNLFFAGKGLSAEDRAIASARVIGTCLATGYEAGRSAVQFLNNDNSSYR